MKLCTNKIRRIDAFKKGINVVISVWQGSKLISKLLVVFSEATVSRRYFELFGPKGGTSQNERVVRTGV